MRAIFKTEKAAVDFSDKIHNWLLKNRKGYNAERWSIPSKSKNGNKWIVKLPEDYPISEKLVIYENLLSTRIKSLYKKLIQKFTH